MKPCHFCKKEINTKKEKYVHVEDWDKGKKQEVFLIVITLKKDSQRKRRNI